MDYVYFKGKGSWFQHLFQFDDKFGKWSIQIHLTPESLEEFKALKLKTHLKMDDDGWYTKLSRPREKLTRGGKRIVFDAPMVFDKDMMPIRKGTNIGNGSDITCKCEIYQYTPPGSKNKENAIRLAEVRIDNLIPYNPDKDYTPEEASAAEGLKDQPKPVF
jgi:hypothetical protein